MTEKLDDNGTQPSFDAALEMVSFFVGFMLRVGCRPHHIVKALCTNAVCLVAKGYVHCMDERKLQDEIVEVSAELWGRIVQWAEEKDKESKPTS